MAFFQVLNQVIALFILLIIGFIVKRYGIITDELNKGLSNLIIKVTLPALLITSMNYRFSQEMFNNSMLILLVGTITYVFMMAIAGLFTRIFKSEEPQKGVYKFLIIFSNTGFMGYPILHAVYGEIGVFYGGVFNLLFNIFLWTLGVILVTPNIVSKDQIGATEKRIFNYRSLINPGIISVIIGFGLFVFSIQIPSVIYNPLKSLGDTTTPLAMVVVGAMLGDGKFKEIISNYKLMAVSFIRLIMIPVAMILILPLFNLPEIVLGTLVIVCGMPAAANTAIFARLYNSDYKLGSQGVFVTTLLSVITIPLMILLLTSI